MAEAEVEEAERVQGIEGARAAASAPAGRRLAAA
jgi:hypothetical protein